MSAGQSFVFSNISASTAKFAILGGKYAMCATGTWSSGNVDLQIVAPDGSTLIDVGSSTKMTANGFAVVDLPPGLYQFTVATATAVYVALTRIVE